MESNLSTNTTEGSAVPSQWSVNESHSMTDNRTLIVREEDCTEWVLPFQVIVLVIVTYMISQY